MWPGFGLSRARVEIVPGDTPEKFTLGFPAPTEDAMKAATAPNMEVHIVASPTSSFTDDYVQFTGTVNGYQ
jgi:hypothetical protein